MSAAANDSRGSRDGESAIVPRLATNDDAANVAEILARGFSDDPLWTWILDEPDRVEKLTEILGFRASKLSTAAGTTHMVDGAVACWHRPGDPDMSDEENQRMLEIVRAVCDRRETKRLAALVTAVAQVEPAEPHWTLGMIATVPSKRGEGRGGRLLEAMLPIVDDSDLPAMLESTNPRNQSLYRRHGFRITGEVTLPDGPTLTVMRRESER